MEVNRTLLLVLLLMIVTFIVTVATHNIEHPESFNKDKISIDLPEEFSQATESDTLIAIKRGNVLHIEFNNN